jgi:hypothetical protein
MLSQGKPKYVNSLTRGRAGQMLLADGPLSVADERQLQASVWSQLGSSPSNASTSRFSLRISLEAETSRRHNLIDIV